MRRWREREVLCPPRLHWGRARGRLWGPDGREAQPPLRLLFSCTFRSFYFRLKNIWLFFTVLM